VFFVPVGARGVFSLINETFSPVQEELSLTMYAPAGCGGRWRVRLVSLARGRVTEQGPVAAIILVADDKVQGCEHGEKKSLELQESMTPFGGPVGGTELGPLGLGREGEGLVVRHSRLLRCCSMPLVKRKKKEVGTSCANFELEEGFDAGGRRSAGLR